MRTNHTSVVIVVCLIGASITSGSPAADSEIRPVTYAHALQLGGADSCTTCAGGSGYCQYVNPRLGCVKYGNPCPKLVTGCCSSILAELFCDVRGRIQGLLSCPLYLDGDCGDCIEPKFGQGRLRDYFPGLTLGGSGLLRSVLWPFCGLCGGSESSIGVSMFEGPYVLDGYADGSCASGGCTDGGSVQLSPEPATPLKANVEPLPTPSSPAAPASTPTINPEAMRRRPAIRRTQYSETEQHETAGGQPTEATTGLATTLQDAGMDRQIRFKTPATKSRVAVPSASARYLREARPGQNFVQPSPRAVQFGNRATKQTYRTMFQ